MLDELFWQDFYAQAVASVHPAACLTDHLPDPGSYRAIKVIAAGKAAAAMAETLEKAWPDQELSGIAVCPYGYERPCQSIEILSAAHPVPDENSLIAAKKALGVASSLRSGDLLLVLLSGGGSALLCAPCEGLPLAAKRDLTQQLLMCGADIGEINTVRSYYSRIKAGGLLAGVDRGASVLTLAVSDVVGDDPSKIASGPTVAEQVDVTQVSQILSQYRIKAPVGAVPDVRPEIYADNRYYIVANAATALATAKRFLSAQGYNIVDMGADTVGEAQRVAKDHSHTITQSVTHGLKEKTAFLSGGELTVTLGNSAVQGKGGPNQEYLLAVMKYLEPGQYAGFAADTDGRDGVGGAAGGYFNPEIHKRAAQAVGYQPYLRGHNSLMFFNMLNSNFNVKPTFTNVNDLRVILFDPSGSFLLTDM